MSKQSVQLVIIGAGPGGYSAAFLAADLGLSVTLIDRDNQPGGVCLRRGCIPSKSFLYASKIICQANEAKNIGIHLNQPEVNLDELRNWKNDVITRLADNLGQMCARKKINYIQGRAAFTDNRKITVKLNTGEEQLLDYDKAIVATGSKPLAFPNAPASSRILSSTNALDLINVPSSLLVIGGGYIGLELGKVYACLGSHVSIVEMTPQLVPGMDRDLTRVLTRRMEKGFKEILLETKVTAINEQETDMAVTRENKKGEIETRAYENILVAIGRSPNLDGLELKNTSIKINAQNRIQTNAFQQTDDPDIYAIGDIVDGPMLAHKAIYEAHIAVQYMVGQETRKRAGAIPAVIFTDPEIAWCGLTETEAKNKNQPVKVLKLPWGASGRATTLNRTDGLTKILVDPDSDKILGMGIVGVDAGELISEGVLALEMGTTIHDLKNTIHPHPTLSETIQDCAKLF